MEKYNYQFGRLGEKIALNYLLKNNYNIIEKNFYCKQGEIDIIAEEKGKSEIIFIEVKTRSNLKYGEPKDAVTIRKRKHMYKTAKYYLYKNYKSNKFIRFDAIEIFISDGKCKVEHIKNLEMS